MMEDNFKEKLYQLLNAESIKRAAHLDWELTYVQEHWDKTPRLVFFLTLKKKIDKS